MPRCCWARWPARTPATRRRSGCPARSSCRPAATCAASGWACPEELTGEGIEPGVLASFNATLDLARELGATVEPCRLPHAPHALSAYYLIAPAEASSNLARYDGVRYGFRAEGARDLLHMYTETREQGFGAEVKRRIMLGTYALSSGYYDAYYGRAQQVRTLISRDFASAWERFDFVATPTAPTVAFELGAKLEDPLAMYLNDFLAVPMSLAGIPGISIPSGLSDGPAGRLPARRPRVQRERAARRRLRAGAGDRLPRRSVEARMTTYEPVIGLEIHVQLDTRTKMFCGCALSFGEPPNTRTCPVCLGLPGTLPVVNAQAVHFALMMGLALGLRDRAAVDLPPQELLLSRPGQELPDLPVRHPDLPRRPAGRRAPAPDPPRGGRGEARPSRRVRPDPRRRRLDRRLQPRRHAAVRDRHRARHPLGRAGARLAQPAPRHPAPARRQRREHGGGLAALRRQRLGPARRGAPSSARRPS